MLQTLYYQHTHFSFNYKISVTRNWLCVRKSVNEASHFKVEAP